MAFTSISSTLYEVGKAVTSNLFTLIVDNLSDLDTRTTALEAVSGTSEIFNFTIVNPSYMAGIASSIVLADHEAISALSITNVRLLQHTAGASGTTTIDVKVGSTLATAASIFSTKPSLDSGDGDGAVDTGTIDDGSVAANELIFLLFDAIQVDPGQLRITVSGEPA